MALCVVNREGALIGACADDEVRIKKSVAQNHHIATDFFYAFSFQKNFR